MEFIRQPASAALAHVVKYYWYFKLTAQETPYTHIGFPYGSFELITYFREPNKMRWLDADEEFMEPSICFAGQVTKPYILSYERSCICGGISFQPWAGNLLFKIPANKFQNKIISFPEIRTDNKFTEEVTACDSPSTLFACFENYISSIAKDYETDPVASYLGKALAINPDHETLNQRLNEIGLSKRRIEQRFIEAAGLNLGTFLKKTRFQQALRLLTCLNKGENLTDISTRLDYYDQSHFIHDFKRFSGMTPTEYIRNRTSLVDFFQTLTEPCC